MRVFWCRDIFPKTVTGGEMLDMQVLEFLKSRSDVEMILPTEQDTQWLTRLRGNFAVNRYFYNRFISLPHGTIILEGELRYIYFYLANGLAKWRRPDLRIAVHANQLPDPVQTPLKNRVVRRVGLFGCLRPADLLTTNGEYLAEQLIGFGARRGRTQPVGTAGQPFLNKTVARQRPADGCVRLLVVGHIRRMKGQIVAVRAMDHLRDRDVELVLVGGVKEEDYGRELDHEIARLGLADRVHRIGRLDGEPLAQAYADADIFIFPSIYEAWGAVAQEAMTSGLPLVGSRTGGIAEQVRDGVEGFLFKPGDPQDLAKKLRPLIDSSELRATMGAAGRKRAAEMPTPAEICENFYRALCALES